MKRKLIDSDRRFADVFVYVRPEFADHLEELRAKAKIAMNEIRVVIDEWCLLFFGGRLVVNSAGTISTVRVDGHIAAVLRERMDDIIQECLKNNVHLFEKSGPEILSRTTSSFERDVFVDALRVGRDSDGESKVLFQFTFRMTPAVRRVSEEVFAKRKKDWSDPDWLRVWDEEVGAMVFRAACCISESCGEMVECDEIFFVGRDVGSSRIGNGRIHSNRKSNS
jgi:hypothetical protein